MGFAEDVAFFAEETAGDPVDFMAVVADQYPEYADVATQIATQFMGERPDPLTEDDFREMNRLARRAQRLQPMRSFSPNEFGRGVPGNPYSVDTSRLQSGVANLASALINRERNRRLLGDDEALEQYRTRQRDLQAQLDGLETGPLVSGLIPGGRLDIGRPESAEARRIREELADAERGIRENQGVLEPLSRLQNQQKQGLAHDEVFRELFKGFVDQGTRVAADRAGVQAREARDIRADNRRHALTVDRLDREQENRLERGKFAAGRRERQTRLESQLRAERETNTPDGRLRNYSNFRDYVNTVLGTNIITNRVNSLERAYANALSEWGADSQITTDTLKELDRARQQLEIANRYREDMIHRSMTSGEVPDAGQIREAYEKELKSLGGNKGSYRNAPWSEDYDPEKEEETLRVLREGLGGGRPSERTAERSPIDVSDLFN